MMPPSVRRWYTLPVSAIIYTQNGIVDVQLIANPFQADSFTISTETFCPN